MSEEKKQKSMPLKIVRCIAYAIGIVAAILIAVISIAVWILTPQRLTPIVTDIANKSLDAEVSLSRAELTFWKTFPTLYIDLDSLTVKSNAFKSLPQESREKLPVYADTLADIGHFRGGINVLALLGGKISLHDVELSGSSVNAVAYDSAMANYNIVAPGE